MSQIKQTSNDPDKYYQIRLKELQSLLNKAESNASKTLLKDAIRLTRDSYATRQRLNQETITKVFTYDAEQLKLDQGLQHYLSQMLSIKDTASNEFFSEDTREKILAAYNGMIKDIQIGYDDKTLMNRSVRDAIYFCNEMMNEVLLEKIYKPDSNGFIFDGIISILREIVGQFIPNSDKAKMILELNISKRKKEYLSSGDKLFSYLEDYIAVLDTWSVLSNQFEKEVLN